MIEFLGQTVLGMSLGMWLAAAALGTWSGLLAAALYEDEVAEREIRSLRFLDPVIHRIFGPDRGLIPKYREEDDEPESEEGPEEKKLISFDQGNEPKRRSEARDRRAKQTLLLSLIALGLILALAKRRRERAKRAH